VAARAKQLSVVATVSAEEELNDSECSATSLTHTARDAHFNIVDSFLRSFREFLRGE
jgi:hypothetical protein